MQVRSLGQDNPPEDMATHSRIFAWRTPGTEEPGGLQSMGMQSLTRRKQLSTCVSTLAYECSAEAVTPLRATLPVSAGTQPSAPVPATPDCSE